MKEKIKRHFDLAKIAVSEKQIADFAKYYRLITDNNDDNDLTRIKGEDQFIIKHFIDSVYCMKFISMPESVVDIGTGAGFPGIPLKIMNPGMRLILAEQRSRRVEFLKLAVERLGLKGVEFYPHKVTDKSFFDVEGVITRALEDAPETLDRVEHFLRESGRVIFLKGPDASGDLLSLTERNRKNFVLELDKNYTLPGTEYSRKILVFRKTASTFSRIYKIMKNEAETTGIAISSAENKFFKETKRLLSGDGLKKSGMMAVPGRKIISDFLDKHRSDELKLILPDDYTETSDDFDAIITGFRKSGSLYVLKKSLFNELEIHAGSVPVLIAPLPVIEEWDGTIEDGCTPVIPFQDPVNVGSAVRSAAGFGIRKIILASGAANPYHPRAVRASSGAVFSVDFLKAPSLNGIYDTALINGIDVMALDKGGDDINGVRFPERFIAVPGVEGPGLPENLRGKCVSIPLSDEVESLNASVALSIFIYEWSKKK